MSKKLGLACGGGGTWSIAILGVLKAFEENNIKVDYIAGCSVGALIGAAYASGFAGQDTIERLEEILTKIKFRQAIHFNRHSSFGMLSPNKIGQQFEEKVGKFNFEDLKIKFAAVATDFRTGEQVVFDHGPLTPALIASTAFTLVFTPFEYQGKLLTDGGVSSPTPSDVVRRMGADVIIGIDCGSKKFFNRLDKKLAVTGRISRLIPLLHFALSRHLGTTFIQLIDLLFSNLNRQYLMNNPVDLLITPKVSHFDQFGFRFTKDFVKEGENAALEALPEIRKLLKE